MEDRIKFCNDSKKVEVISNNDTNIIEDNENDLSKNKVISFINEDLMHNIDLNSKSSPCVYKDQERFLPLAVVNRIMRLHVPNSCKISNEAKECMQECISELIGFFTSEASDKCIFEKRRTITGEDIINSLANLGFDNYIPILTCILAKYRQSIRYEISSNKEFPSDAHQ